MPTLLESPFDLNRPLPYDKIREEHENAKRSIPRFSNMSLEEYSRFMNDATGSNRYQQGINNSLVKRASYGIDQALEATGVPGVAESFGRGIGRLVAPQYEEELGQTAKEIPRTLAVGAAGTALGGPIGGAAALGADAAARTYTDTDSIGASLISGGVAAALPAVGKFGEGVAGKTITKSLFAKKLADGVISSRKAFIPVERGIEYLAGQAAQQGAQEIGTQAQSLAQGEGFQPITIGSLAKNAIMNLPYAFMDIPYLVKGPKVDGKRIGISEGEVQRIREAEARRSQIEQEPVEAEAAPATSDVTERAIVPTIISAHDKTGTGLTTTRPIDVWAAPSPPDTREIVPTVIEGWDRNFSGLAIRPEGSVAEQNNTVNSHLLNWASNQKLLTDTAKEKGLEPGPVEPEINRRIQENLDQGKSPEEAIDLAVNSGAPVTKPRTSSETGTPDAETLSAQVDPVKRLEQVTGQKPEEAKAAYDSIQNNPYAKAALDKELNDPLPQLNQQRWFARYFSEQGFRDQALADRVAFTDRLLNGFSNQSVIATISDETKRGIFAALNSEEGVIGLNKSQAVKGEFAEPFNLFEKFFVLGHEAFHATFDSYKRGVLDPKRNEILKQTFDAVEDIPLELRKTYLKDALDILVPQGVRSKNSQIKQYLEHISDSSSKDSEEFLSTFSSLLALGTASPKRSETMMKDFKDMLRFSDPHIAEFGSMIYRDLAEAMPAISSFYKISNPDTKLSIAGKQVGVGDLLEQVGGNLKQILKTREEIASAIARAGEIESSITPSGVAAKWQEVWGDKINTDYKQASKSIDSILKNDLNSIGIKSFDAPTFNKAVQDFRKKIGFDPVEETKDYRTYIGYRPKALEMFMSAFQFAERHPIARPIINTVFNFRSYAQDAANALVTPFMIDVKSGKEVRLDSKNSVIRTVQTNSKVKEALNKIFLWQNENEKVMDDAEIDKRLASFDANTRNAAKMFHSITQDVMPKVSQVLVRGLKSSMDSITSHILMNQDATLKSRDAGDLGSRLTDSIIKQKSANPAEAELANQEMMQWKAQLGEGRVSEIERSLEPVIKKFQETSERISEKPWFTPETRNDPWIVLFRSRQEDGKLKSGSIGAKNEKEALDVLNRLKQEGKIDVRISDRYASREEFGGASRDVVESFQKFEQAAFDAIKNKVSDETFEEFSKNFSPGTAALREISARRYGGHLSRRKLAEGRESLDFVDGIMNYIYGAATGAARQKTREEVSLLLRDPKLTEADAQGNMKRLLNQYAYSVINATPDSPAARTIKNLIFHTYLGGNVSSLLVEGSQGMLSLAPWLTEQGAGIGGSYRLMKDAAAEIAKWSTGKKVDAELAEAWKRAEETKEISTGILEQFNELGNDATLMNIRRLGEDRKGLYKVGDMLASPFYAYAKGARFLYSQASNINSRLAFTAGYKLARSRGMDSAEAYDYGVRTVRATMFAGGQAGRPLFFSHLGKASSPVGVLYSLQHYTVSMFSMMGRMLSDSLGRNPELSAEQVKNSRKALGQMLATQAVMAGALGLPGAGAAIGVLQQIFPNLNLEEDMRKMVASLAGEDDEMGNFLADMALKGPLTALTGIDVSGRFGLGNVLGIDNMNGITPEAAFGPAGSMIGDWFGAVSQGAQGNYLDAFQKVVPNAFRQAIGMARNDWSLVDGAGKKVLEVSDADKILLALGFRPREISAKKEQIRLQKRSEKIQSRQLQSFYRDMADLLQDGKVEDVRTALLERENQDPYFKAKVALPRITEIVQERQTPVDPLRLGTKVTARQREELARTFPTMPRTKEVDRLMERKQLERSVGIRGAGTISPNEISRARMIDQIIARNPGISYSTAVQMLDREFRRRMEALNQ
ncbi:MAG: PLxRFG domain-containing protein [Verrucomicrobiae bacterium]|nr:PLxRFG domain-containing protein [Verrucomicrobiae bacterium]